MSSRGSSMPQLAEDLVVNILSRLPAKTILHCRCVRKLWCTLLTNSTYFTNLHLSRSPTGLIIHHDPQPSPHIRSQSRPNPGFLKMVEIEDEPHYHNLRRDPAMTLDLNLGASFRKSKLSLVGSVNGLLCLWQYNLGNDKTYICNPITREYMILPKQEYSRKSNATIVYGFRMSSITGEYKVVRSFEGDISSETSYRPSLLEGEVYTLGTGQWRSLGHVPHWLSENNGTFLNGCSHWSVCEQDLESPETICLFDFENESFQLFPSPPRSSVPGIQCLGVLSETEFVIWVMKDYGIKNSWSRQILVTNNHQDVLDHLLWRQVYVIKDLKDGTILMMYYVHALLAFCPERITIVDTGIFQNSFTTMSFTPSFIRLRNFALENVRGF